MEYVIAQNNEEDFRGFAMLEEEFDRHYVDHGIGEHYIRVPFAEKPESVTRTEFENSFKGDDGFFLFAKEGDEYAGYIDGYVKENDPSYKTKRLGILNSIIVAEKYRGKGVSNQMRDMFFEWLRSKNVEVCQLYVIAKNTPALEVYKKWGFEVDELRLWKKI